MSESHSNIPTNIPKLLPKVSAITKAVLEEKGLLFELTKAFGSPLNLVFPEQIVHNFNSFKKIFADQNILGKIFYAHKPNRSSALVKALSMLPDAYIDVASEQELQHALSYGFTGNRIGATGPKNISFLILAMQHQVLISVDSISELQTIHEVQTQLNLKHHIPITIRLNAIHKDKQAGVTKDSRFGVRPDELNKALEIIISNKKIELQGFAFHLSSTSVKERARAIKNTLTYFDIANQAGLNPTMLNIGGGYKVSYLQNKKDWTNFETELKKSVLGERDSFTWNNQHFGLQLQNKVLAGNLNTYQYYSDSAADAFLKEVFEYTAEGDSQSIGEILRDSMIEVCIEPGRALLDQCGITIGSVLLTKESQEKNKLIGVEMNRSDMSFADQEVLIDPILIPKQVKKNAQPFVGFLTGNLCLEADLLSQRKIVFDNKPEPGDLLVFANTAGYFSDFSAHNAIMQPKAPKLAITTQNEKITWTLDSQYSPVQINVSSKN
jgi:diaminopimelate decarboxylase